MSHRRWMNRRTWAPLGCALIALVLLAHWATHGRESQREAADESRLAGLYYSYLEPTLSLWHATENEDCALLDSEWVRDRLRTLREEERGKLLLRLALEPDGNGTIETGPSVVYPWHSTVKWWRSAPGALLIRFASGPDAGRDFRLEPVEDGVLALESGGKNAGPCWLIFQRAVAPDAE